MGSVTPDEFWERMRSNRGSGEQRPERSPEVVSEPARSEQAGESAHQPAWVAPPPPSPPPSRGEDANGGARSEPEESSTGELVKQLTEQTKTLVQQEMRLAKTELQQKGKKVGIGAGLFGAGGLVAFFGAAALVVALVLALSTALAPWLSALIVGVVLLAVAGGAALMGKRQVEQATPPVPEQTVETVKEDVQHVKSRAKR